MKPTNLIGFSALCLEKCERNGQELTPYRVKKFIRNHPDSGADIPISDIRTVLDFLVQVGLFEITDSDQEKYQRYIPARCRRIKE